MSDLAHLNSTTLGAAFPEVTLPDGSKVQTGTVGALLVNIERYNKLHAAEGDNKEQMEGLDRAFLAAVPLLKKVGLFGLFSVDEWMAEGGSAGRRRVGELARQQGVDAAPGGGQ